MTLHVLSQQNTVLNKFIAEIRDRQIQKDSMRFRRNMERIGEITAYEISKALHYRPTVVETPLGEAEVAVIDDQLVIATILRAGLPYHQGFLNYFDDAQNAFVSAYRKSTKEIQGEGGVYLVREPGREDAAAGGSDAGDGFVAGSDLQCAV